MREQTPSPESDERVDLKQAAEDQLPFLYEMGFVRIDVIPELVRYIRNGIEVEVYRELYSQETGIAVVCSGNRYSLSELIRLVDPATADRFRDVIATTQKEAAKGLHDAGELLLRYGGALLQGDPSVCTALAKQREEWSRDFALSVLADQLRPKAEEAYRQGDYLKAAELYSKIRSKLNPTELKKLAVSEQRSKQ